MLPRSEAKQFYKTVFALVIPIAMQNLINAAVTSADVFMLGNYSEVALSAASLAGQIQFIMLVVLFGLNSGAAILVSQYWGKGSADVIEKLLNIAIRFAMGIALIFTIAGMVFPAWCISMFTPDAEIIAEGAKYLRILSISFMLSAVTLAYLNVMKCVEKAFISVAVFGSSLLFNIAINYLLIFGSFGFPRLGAQGAAIATVSARVIELIIALCYSKKKSNPVKLVYKRIDKEDRWLYKDFLKYSMPVTVNEFIWSFGIITATAILSRYGRSVISANAVAQTTRQLATVLSFGVANATAIVLGKIIGEGRLKDAETGGRRLIRLAILIGAAAGIGVFMMTPFIQRLVNLSAESAEHLKMMLMVMCYSVAAQTYAATMIVGVFRAGGDTMFGLVADASTTWAVSVFLGAVCAFVFKLSVPVVYVVLLSDEVIKIPVTYLRYRKKYWLRNVTRDTKHTH